MSSNVSHDDMTQSMLDASQQRKLDEQSNKSRRRNRIIVGVAILVIVLIVIIVVAAVSSQGMSLRHKNDLIDKYTYARFMGRHVCSMCGDKHF